MKELKELEEYFYAHRKKEGVATSNMADIVGVYAGIKPACVVGFNEEESFSADLLELKEILSRFGMFAVFSFRAIRGAKSFYWNEDVYISKEKETAMRLKDAFEKMWKTIDDLGEIIKPEEWNEETLKIGKLLGYPMTAVEAFISDRDVMDDKDCRSFVDEKNRYYAHSKEFEREEFELYDKPLNLAIEKCAPRVAKIMKSDEKKRWTEFLKG